MPNYWEKKLSATGVSPKWVKSRRGRRKKEKKEKKKSRTHAKPSGPKKVGENNGQLCFLQPPRVVHASRLVQNKAYPTLG